MKTVEIKSIKGETLYSHTCENNSLKITLEKAFSENFVFKYANLSNLDLSDIEFSNSEFYKSMFINSKFYDSKFYDSRFYKNKFNNSEFLCSKFFDSEFFDSEFNNSNFYDSRFYDSEFNKSMIYNSNFLYSEFNNSNFYDSRFYDSEFYYSTYNGEKIIDICNLNNAYKYASYAVSVESGNHIIRLGCLERSAQEWESDFWNNNREFPNDGSEKSEMRLLTFQMLKMWCEKKYELNK